MLKYDPLMSLASPSFWDDLDCPIPQQDGDGQVPSPCNAVTEQQSLIPSPPYSGEGSASPQFDLEYQTMDPVLAKDGLNSSMAVDIAFEPIDKLIDADAGAAVNFMDLFEPPCSPELPLPQVDLLEGSQTMPCPDYINSGVSQSDGTNDCQKLSTSSTRDSPESDLEYIAVVVDDEDCCSVDSEELGNSQLTATASGTMFPHVYNLRDRNISKSKSGKAGPKDVNANPISCSFKHVEADPGMMMPLSSQPTKVLVPKTVTSVCDVSAYWPSSGNGQGKEILVSDKSRKGLSSAEQARLNRQKKKAYIQGLEGQIAGLTKENDKLKAGSAKLRSERDSLQEEVLYLRNVLANDSALAGLLSNINNVKQVHLTTSFAKGRKRLALDADHDYGRPTPAKRKFAEPSNVSRKASGGVCLHVDSNKVSMEFCAKCASMAQDVDSTEDA